MKQRKNRRPLSAGTVFMLILSVAVIAGSAVVLGRLSSGASVDLSKLNMNVLDLQEDPAHAEPDEAEDEPKATVRPAVRPSATDTPEPTDERESFTLTVGGSYQTIDLEVTLEVLEQQN